MANVFGERLPVLRRVLDHPWVKIALAVWAIIAAYDTFSSQILPEWLAAKAPKVREVVAMTSGWLPYWAWLLILAALLVVASFEYAFRRTDLGFNDARITVRKGSLHNMIALAGMIIFGLGFVGSATFYFWPHSSIHNSSSGKSAIKDAYLKDFNLLSKEVNFSLEFNLPTGMRNRVDVLGKMYYDFDARSKFLSFFVPPSFNFVDACKDVVNDIQEIVKHAEAGVEVQGGHIGQLGMTSGKDIPFSGRVYLYHETPMTTTYVFYLLTIAKNHNIDLVFRSHEYLRGSWTLNLFYAYILYSDRLHRRKVKCGLQKVPG